MIDSCYLQCEYIQYEKTDQGEDSLWVNSSIQICSRSSGLKVKYSTGRKRLFPTYFWVVIKIKTFPNLDSNCKCLKKEGCFFSLSLYWMIRMTWFFWQILFFFDFEHFIFWPHLDECLWVEIESPFLWLFCWKSHFRQLFFATDQPWWKLWDWIPVPLTFLHEICFSTTYFSKRTDSGKNVEIESPFLWHFFMKSVFLQLIFQNEPTLMKISRLNPRSFDISLLFLFFYNFFRKTVFSMPKNRDRGSVPLTFLFLFWFFIVV